MRRQYPDRIAERGFPSETSVVDYDVRYLIVDDKGDVANPPSHDKGDHFVIVSGLNDTMCLLRFLSPEVLRTLSNHGRYAEPSGFSVRAPRAGRDDLVTFGYSTHRKTCIYGAKFLCGKADVTPSDVDEFLTDLRRFTDMRPIVGNAAKKLMQENVRRKHVCLQNVRDKTNNVPEHVSRLFYEHGRGGNVDTLVLGHKGSEVKVDQKTSFLSAMAKLDSTMENITYGVFWREGGYDPDDAYGIYCIDGEVDPSFGYTPIYKEINDTLFPIVGKFHDVKVLKPTMDDFMLLVSLGKAELSCIQWSWHLKAQGKHPYEELYKSVESIKQQAGASKHFWKLVACAIWGQTLETHTIFDNHGKPTVEGGVYFNPIIGFTTTDLMRHTNFLMKLKSDGKVSAEVVDMLTGTDGSWHDNGSVGVKGPLEVVHLNTLFHVATGDDKLGLIDELKNSRRKFIERVVHTRHGLDIFRFLSAGDAAQIFASTREKKVRIRPGNSKRHFPAEFKGIELRDLLTTYVELLPYTEESAKSAPPDDDGLAQIFEMGSGTLLEKLLRTGGAR